MTCCHFIHPEFIRCLMSILPWSGTTDPRYRMSQEICKDIPERVMSTKLQRPPKSQMRYPVLILLTFKPTLTSLCRHSSNLLWTSRPSSAASAMSSANSMRQWGVSSCISDVKVSNTTRKSYGLRADSWCKPTATFKLEVVPVVNRICVLHRL